MFVVIVSSLVGQVLAQQARTLDPDEAQKGHRFAVTLCAICHISRHPAAPSFASIVERKEFNAAWLTHFMTTTHRGLDKPSGMANPERMGYQIKVIVAYKLNVRK
jgi:hypothetical protein